MYQAFVQSQDYATEHQQEWAKAGKDHHRAFDEKSCFILRYNGWAAATLC